ncbi:AmmeMemoRadiSam system protein B, partial [Candidatus Woesearchaeota archaeon]|nr:AmmeMemoRadiSam system protein B [Candidatus Woesearchaeota archaeon]
AIVAGQFYEGNEKELREQIRECFTSSFGPGKLPAEKTTGEIKAVISPHAGFSYSGAAASHVYKKIAESKKPDVFLILGTNHTGLGQTSVCLDDFETPLGVAKVDKKFGEELVKNSKINNDPSVHKFEHSIEVQIPFLQFIFNDFKFVPIVVSSPAYLDEIADAVRKTVRKTGKKVCIIVSGDFTHYGLSYGFSPFSDNIRENIEKLDMGAIEEIKKMGAEGFISYVNETHATICGYLPIALMIKILGKGDVELLKYYTSGDITGDHNTSVSYAGIVIR